MTDRELLEQAADAIGLPPLKFIGSFVGYWDQSREGKGIGCNVYWNPLVDDGDALRLAVKLGLMITVVLDGEPGDHQPQTLAENCVEMHGVDGYAATRRAIVRAAAALAKEQRRFA